MGLPCTVDWKQVLREGEERRGSFLASETTFLWLCQHPWTETDTYWFNMITGWVRVMTGTGVYIEI